jgi:hypothetical protein
MGCFPFENLRIGVRCQVEELGRGRTMEKLTTFLVASGHGPQILQIFFGGFPAMAATITLN